MNFFRIFVQGESFDIDAYLKSSSLTFNEVWHLGDDFGNPLFIVNKRSGSGAIIMLGDGGSLPFHEQVRIAAEFLQANEQELRALTQFPGVQTAYVNLLFKCEFQSDVCGTELSLSKRLMYFLLRAGMDLDITLDLQRIEESMD